ncbi:MAG: hypothetical protein R2867_46035 [Caldilineaceae bacterium]
MNQYPRRDLSNQQLAKATAVTGPAEEKTGLPSPTAAMKEAAETVAGVADGKQTVPTRSLVATQAVDPVPIAPTTVAATTIQLTAAPTNAALAESTVVQTAAPQAEAPPPNATAQAQEEQAQSSASATVVQANVPTDPSAAAAAYTAAVNASALIDVPLVFVSRRITEHGTVYWEQAKGMPGVGPFSRFEVAAPGRLLVLEPNGTVRILVDGANPSPASLNLIDVSAPSVSYDGQDILFAGLPMGDYESGYMTDPGAWRIYAMQIDGSNLHQLTFSDRDALDLSQFGALADVFKKYDDTDPAWLPDGRIVFSSTRWPAFGQYGGARASNLFVMDADGSNMHRITSERNGADRPLIDPLSGQIVYSRWWRNFRVPTNSMASMAAINFDGIHQRDGLLAYTDSTEEDPIPGGTPNVGRNAWHLGVINPDGCELKLFTGGSGIFLLGEDANHAYGGAFAPDGTLYANYYPMKNMTEASGFGGIRLYQRTLYLSIDCWGDR